MSLFHQSTSILMPPRFALPLCKGEGTNSSNEQSGLKETLMNLDVPGSFNLHLMGTLRTRLHVFQTAWRCCSSLHGNAMPRRRV